MYLRDSPHKKMSSRSAKIRRISETLFSTRNAYETVLRFSRLAERIDLERVPNRSSGPPVVAVRSSNRQPLHHPKLLPLREKTIWRFTFFGRCGRGSGMKQHIEPDGFGKEITT